MSVIDSLIASGIFITVHGTLTGVRDIKVIDTSTDDLYDPSVRLSGQCQDNERGAG